MAQSANDPSSNASNTPLVDGFGRVHDYLRISLTERCNLRCRYCMPVDGVPLLPASRYMQVEEIHRLARLFVDLGIRKIRLTGGEPLVRKDFAAILEGLSPLDVDLGLTTNGVLLPKYLDALKASGLRSINVSLDSLQRERFLALTHRDDYVAVRAAIEEAVDAGFSVKVNAVLLRNRNEDEIQDFVQWSADQPVHVRFIEFMPFDGNRWRWEEIVPFKEVMQTVEAAFPIEKLEDGPNDTARAYRVVGGKGTFGVIASMTQPFCSTCNRLRLTADGKIRNCLFSDTEMDLLGALRAGQPVEPLIRESLAAKKAKHGGMTGLDHLSAEAIPHRSMIRIGG
jgi:cyclic pyranopterin phosphate synthase